MTKFIIYGANGWMGKATIFYIVNYLKKIENIIAVSSSVNSLKVSGKQIRCFNLEDVLHSNKAGQYILFNYSFILPNTPTGLNESNYIKKVQNIRDNATKLIKYFNPEKVIYSSTGAIYKQNNIYGKMKKADENYYIMLSKMLNFKILIPRIFNLGGVFINKDTYALSNLINQAIYNEQIKIYSKKIIRSYIDVIDLIKILFAWIFDDKANSDLFDTGNKSIEMHDLASLILENMNLNKKIIRKIDNSTSDEYYGNIVKQSYLADKYSINISDNKKIIDNTIKYIKNVSRY